MREYAMASLLRGLNTCLDLLPAFFFFLPPKAGCYFTINRDEKISYYMLIRFHRYWLEENVPAIANL